MAQVSLRIHASDAFRADQLAALRRMLDGAFDSFTDDDWAHTLGGIHVWVEVDQRPVSHASYVTRRLELSGEWHDVAYVEAVATSKESRRMGYGSRVMAQVSELIRGSRRLGALSTHRHGFYARFGWERWRGPTFVAAPEGRRETPEDDGDIMVLRTPTSPPLALDAPIACDWRCGDVW